ncbi:MAG: aromatic acid decarboxylase [Gemmatimonadetes bacterium]|jgi:4-hydroxy-3-polyprenylbenzoate decarboxylase|nr:aromatic acid decarboxylase [Gemmatimonadota bacterium]HCK08903.1 aromatic acid decarboxylase [Candidatus Latescibacterota bacterium]
MCFLGNSMADRLTLAVTGASGAIYATRTLRGLLITGLQVDLVVSETGWMLLRDETGFHGNRGEFASYVEELFGGEGRVQLHQAGDFAAPIASGSVQSRGMVIVPCAMKYLAGVANGSSSNLIERAADVTLKERRPLVIVPRETPMNLVHLRNQVSAAEAGATILPANPAFYQKPETFEDLADFIAGRILSIFGLEHSLYPTWKGE